MKTQRCLPQVKQSVTAVDGSVKYTVFDKVAVHIKVEETTGGRRRLVLSLAPRDALAHTEVIG